MAHAQQPVLTMGQAVERALVADPEIASQKQEIIKYQGNRITSSLPPNPELAYAREDIESGTSSRGEEILLVEFPIHFLWKRSPRINEADARIRSVEHANGHARAGRVFDVREAYLAYHFAALDNQVWNAIIDELINIMKDIDSRLNQGDLAGFDHDRMYMELNRIYEDRRLAELDWRNAWNRLTVFMNEDTGTGAYQTVVQDPGITGSINREQLVQGAFEHREDLKAAVAAHHAEESAIAAVRCDVWPDVIVGVGFKREFDDLNGPVSRIGFNLPVFDRNQGLKQSTKAVRDGAALKVEAVRRDIRREVEQAHNRFEVYRDLYERMKKREVVASGLLLETARLSYLEGELGVTELIDVVRVHLETQLRSNRINHRYLLSLNELEYVTGAAFTAQNVND